MRLNLTQNVQLQEGIATEGDLKLLHQGKAPLLPTPLTYPSYI